MRIYEEPLFGFNYLVYADAAKGMTARSDKTSIQVCKRGTVLEQVACDSLRIDPENLAYLMVKVADHYNNAMVCPENNPPGDLTSRVLRKIGYNKMFFDPAVSGIEFGLRVSSKTKPLMIENLDMLINNMFNPVAREKIILHDRETIQQMMIFIRLGEDSKGDGKECGAMGTGHDDHVMAMAGAAYINLIRPITADYGVDSKNILNINGELIDRRKYLNRQGEEVFASPMDFEAIDSPEFNDKPRTNNAVRRTAGTISPTVGAYRMERLKQNYGW